MLKKLFKKPTTAEQYLNRRIKIYKAFITLDIIWVACLIFFLIKTIMHPEVLTPFIYYLYLACLITTVLLNTSYEYERPLSYKYFKNYLHHQEDNTNEQ